MSVHVQVKASYKLSEDFKKGPPKKKVVKKPAAKKVCLHHTLIVTHSLSDLGQQPKWLLLVRNSPESS